MTVHSRNNYDLTYCWAVPRNYRRTEVLVFHGTSTVEVTVLTWYRNVTNTALLPYGTCQPISHFSENFRARNQFIYRWI